MDTPAATSSVPVISISADCTPDAQAPFTITNIGSSMNGLMAAIRTNGSFLSEWAKRG